MQDRTHDYFDFRISSLTIRLDLVLKVTNNVSLIEFVFVNLKQRWSDFLKDGLEEISRGQVPQFHRTVLPTSQLCSFFSHYFKKRIEYCTVDTRVNSRCAIGLPCCPRWPLCRWFQCSLSSPRGPPGRNAVWAFLKPKKTFVYFTFWNDSQGHKCLRFSEVHREFRWLYNVYWHNRSPYWLCPYLPLFNDLRISPNCDFSQIFSMCH